MTPRIALVSCVKSKREVPSAAKDLYTSPLFRLLRRYAELHADEWYILSARYGLLEPDTLVDPYEQTLNHMPKSERDRWASRVKDELLKRLPADAAILVLAGERYRAELLPFLRIRGHRVDVPLAGLKFGQQLQRLKSLTDYSGSSHVGR